MYENIIGQDFIVVSLKEALHTNRLPPSLLFSGPVASGKMTTALETARLLSCEEKGEWNCPCAACARHRKLLHTDLMLLGPRSFPEEITVARELLLRAPGKSSAHFFVRSIQKLLRRFDAALWEGEEGKLGKAVQQLRDIEELLPVVDPDTSCDAPLSENYIQSVEALTSLCAKLEAFVPDAPPVFMVRNMELWARTAPAGNRKTVIIENADRMLDSARNAMLKILEEPPESVRFILLTSRRASLMATILSRSRTYPFALRSAEATVTVLRRVFKTEEKYENLAAYLETRKPFSSEKAHEFAQLFLGAILKKNNLSPFSIIDDLAKISGDFGMKDERMNESFTQFLKALLDALGGILRNPAAGTSALIFAERMSGLLRETGNQYHTFNRNPDLLLRVLVTNAQDVLQGTIA